MTRASVRFTTPALLSLLVGALSGCSGCGDNPEAVENPSSTAAGGTSTGGHAGTSTGGSSVGGAGNGGEAGSVVGGTAGSTAATAGTGNTPCDPSPCSADQKCTVTGGTASCAFLTCADLNCVAPKICIEATSTAGATCKDNTCTSALDCPPEQYCNGTTCVDDVCVAGERHCDGLNVTACASDGGGLAVVATCGSITGFPSVCVETSPGVAGCSCVDDWDCPAYMDCDVGLCVGTGVAPTCKLAPVPFTDIPPTIEIQWGGASIANHNATGSPFPKSAQVVMTPVVANLDDDNGDGLINERDFAEIIFLTFCDSVIDKDGVLRAIHGGGPNKGKDYFAALGTTVWHEGDDTGLAYNCGDATINSTAAVAVGDLDNDGKPEIVVITETNGIAIHANDGTQIYKSASNLFDYGNPAPTLANLDGQGFAEIVVGRDVFTLEKDAGTGKLKVLDHFSGNLSSGTQGQGPVSCVADITGDARQEIIGGSTVYSLPRPPAGVTKISECVGPYSDAESIAFCAGKLRVAWDGQTVNGTTVFPNAKRDGFCAIADILGADQTAAPGPSNPLDGTPEVILINDGFLYVLNGQTGEMKRKIDLGAGADGGAPNVDDFDGDGFPEVGTAFGTGYLMMDLQDPSTACPVWPQKLVDGQTTTNPARTPNGKPCTGSADCGDGAVCNTVIGECACLYNAWSRKTEDDSSRVTGSSVFDFNGDGAAEVIYNDECWFRIYNGQNGDVYTKEHSPSRTRIEYPVVADVDNDGNAEIVFATSNESGFCSEPNGNDFNNGLEVWGDATDSWVSARRIWNQHAYHVTNVTEGGGIPQLEPPSWKTYSGRSLNTYRSNPRSSGVAPDLVVARMQVSSPDSSCGTLSTNLSIVAEIKNQGDLRVGPGVVVGFSGHWASPALDEALNAAMGGPVLTFPLQTTLEPGSSVFITVPYNAANNTPGTLPSTITATVDVTEQERECIETNNTATADLATTAALADLRLVLGAPAQNCPSVGITGTLYNDGAIPVSNVLVRFFAGDPDQGGFVLGDTTVPGPIAAGANVPVSTSFANFPQNSSILIYGVADPLNAIPECNDANNKDDATQRAECDGIQ